MSLKIKIQRAIDENKNPLSLADEITLITDDFALLMLTYIQSWNITIKDSKFYLPDGRLIADNNKDMVHFFKTYYNKL